MANWRWSVGFLLGGILMYTAPVFCAQQTSPLTSLEAIHAISNAEAARSIPVVFEATVTYYEKKNVDLFVQDGDVAIYVETSPDLEIETGDRVRVEGMTRASFRPEIAAKRVTFLHHGAPPPAVEASFEQLIRAELDCRRATVRGVVRTADLFSDGASKSLLLDVIMPGGHLQAQIASGHAAADLHDLLDSTVVITGAVAGKFDSKSQMTGVLLEVPSYSDLQVVHRPQVDPNQLPLQPFDEILRAANIDDQTERVRVAGTITYYQPGAAMVLQDGSQALWVDTLSEAPHRVNDYALVTGFPAVRNGSVVLTQGEIERSWPNQDLKPMDVDAEKLASGSHAFELVSLEGQLITQVRAAAQDEYVIASGDRVFATIYRHPERGLNLPVPPMRKLRPGSRVRVVGICVLDRGDQFRGPVAFHVLLRSPDEVVRLAGPSLISVRNLGILLGLLLILVFLAIGRGLLLERKLRKQDQARASAVERWRNRVIDGIQKVIPLQETLLQITELLAFRRSLRAPLETIRRSREMRGCSSPGNPFSLIRVRHWERSAWDSSQVGRSIDWGRMRLTTRRAWPPWRLRREESTPIWFDDLSLIHSRMRATDSRLTARSILRSSRRQDWVAASA
jgi:hypothetical protein